MLDKYVTLLSHPDTYIQNNIIYYSGSNCGDCSIGQICTELSSDIPTIILPQLQEQYPELLI